MFQKIANALSVEVEGTDLTKATKIEFYVRQGCSFFQYEPTVVDETHLLVKIPYADAMRLQASTVRLLLDGAESRWWTRSPSINGTTNFIFVSSAGTKGTIRGGAALGVPFCFCF